MPSFHMGRKHQEKVGVVEVGIKKVSAAQSNLEKITPLALN